MHSPEIPPKIAKYTFSYSKSTCISKRCSFNLKMSYNTIQFPSLCQLTIEQVSYVPVCVWCTPDSQKLPQTKCYSHRQRLFRVSRAQVAVELSAHFAVILSRGSGKGVHQHFNINLPATNLSRLNWELKVQCNYPKE